MIGMLLWNLIGCSRSATEQDELAEELINKSTDIEGMTDDEWQTLKETHHLSENEAEILRLLAVNNSYQDVALTEDLKLRFTELIGDSNKELFTHKNYWTHKLAAFRKASEETYTLDEAEQILSFSRSHLFTLIKDSEELSPQEQDLLLLDYYERVFDILRNPKNQEVRDLVYTRSFISTPFEHPPQTLTSYIEKMKTEVGVTGFGGTVGHNRGEVFRKNVFDATKDLYLETNDSNAKRSGDEPIFVSKTLRALARHPDIQDELITSLKSKDTREVEMALVTFQYLDVVIVGEICSKAPARHADLLAALKALLEEDTTDLNNVALVAKILQNHPELDPNGETLALLVKKRAWQAIINILDTMSVIGGTSDADIIKQHRKTLTALKKYVQSQDTSEAEAGREGMPYHLLNTVGRLLAKI